MDTINKFKIGNKVRIKEKSYNWLKFNFIFSGYNFLVEREIEKIKEVSMLGFIEKSNQLFPVLNWFYKFKGSPYWIEEEDLELIKEVE